MHSLIAGIIARSRKSFHNVRESIQQFISQKNYKLLLIWTHFFDLSRVCFFCFSIQKLSKFKDILIMFSIQNVCCPNCGRPAERHHIHESKITRTQCPSCDYLMVTCALSGKVIEAYAPGIVADLKQFSFAGS
jgi:hypothetical protein